MDQTSGQSKANGVVSRLNLPAWYWPLASLLAGFYVATSLFIAARRLLWFDEIFTALICRLPTAGAVWKACSEGVEQIPPLYFLIARLFDQVFGHADIGIRVPSALALGIGLLVTFDLVRRLTDGLYGLIAMSLVSTSFVTYYGHEARPYALCFMLAAMALWLWIVPDAESKAAAPAFGALFLAGVALHYYFLLCLLPFGLLALADRRIFHPKTIAAAAGAIVALAVLYPQIASSREAVRTGIVASWTPPSLTGLQAVYPELFPLAAVPLAVIAVGVLLWGRPRERLLPSMNTGERLGWLFLAVPLAAYPLALLATNFFNLRYLIGAVPGITAAVTCLFYRHCRESRILSLAILIALGGFGIFYQMKTASHVDDIYALKGRHEQVRHMLALEAALEREGKLRIATEDKLLYLEAWYYSRHRDRYEYIRSQAWGLERYAAVNLLSVEQVAAHARETAVIDPNPAFAQALERAGLQLKVRFAEPLSVVYLE